MFQTPLTPSYVQVVPPDEYVWPLVAGDGKSNTAIMLYRSLFLYL
jgi:hypothetical protein